MGMFAASCVKYSLRATNTETFPKVAEGQNHL